jgi:membrane dipeptidase
MVAVFDGHNDAITREDAADFATGRAGGHLDLPRARAGGLAGGMFAIFTPTPGYEDRVGDRWDENPPLAEPIGPDLGAPHATRAAGRLHALEREGHVRIARAPGDLDAARADGALAAVIHLEGAEAIDPELEALDHWHAAGLRSLGPVWSRPNAFGHGVPFAFPSSPDTGPGLTAAGTALVRRCAEVGIAVDLSHLNEAGFWDVARLDGAPLIASHSGVHALSPSARNLTDAQLDAIGASGGVVGIVFAVGFLRADGADDADTPLSAIVAHVRHAAERIGVEHVALGSDFDGATVPDELGDVAGLPRLIEALRADGLTEASLRPSRGTTGAACSSGPGASAAKPGSTDHRGSGLSAAAIAACPNATPPSLGGRRSGTSTRTPARWRRSALRSSSRRFWKAPPDSTTVPSPRSAARSPQARAVASASAWWKRVAITPAGTPRATSRSTASTVSRASSTPATTSSG